MDVEYARRFPRLVAWTVDVIIASVLLWLILGVIAYGDVIEMFVDGTGGWASASYIVVQIVVGLGYFVVLTAVWGATLGKVAMRMKVVDAGGAKPGFGAVLLREFIVAGLPQIATIMLTLNGGGFVSALIIVLVVFPVLVDDRRQGLHDKLARTFVVRA